MSDTETNPAAYAEQLMPIAMGYINTQILLNADALGVFDFLEGGPRDVDAIAQGIGIGRDPAERLLIGCTVLGLVSRDGDAFALTDASRACLVKSAPTYMGGLFPFTRSTLYRLFHSLSDSLQDPKPQWDKVPGMAPGGPFEAMYADPEELARFQDAMFGLAYPTAMAASEKFDFGAFDLAVDVGGGTGGFVNGLCQRFPSLRGRIFDLPPVESAARATIARLGLEGRVDFEQGDFFSEPIPTDADLIILGDILHDWSEAEGTAILEKVYEALPEGGALCVQENILTPERDGSYVTAMINLTMLVAATGKQHSPAEFETWLGGIGFKRFEHHYLAAPRDVLIAWK